MRKQQFDSYMNKLISYCELMNFKLYTSDVHEDYCMLDKREIVICTKYTREEQIAACLHEIGHLLDYAFNAKLFKKAKAYNATIKDNHELTYYERKQLILIETRAWQHGESLAKMLKIRIKQLDTIKRTALSSYYKIKVKSRSSEIK